MARLVTSSAPDRCPVCSFVRGVTKVAHGLSKYAGLALVRRRVLQAIQDDESYILTHTGERNAITAPVNRIKAAFDRADEVMPTIVRS
jgi:hypothetical protein